MTPKEKLTALVQEIRLNSGVGSPLRKTAHDLSYSDAILITREEFQEAVEAICTSSTDILVEELVSILWK